MYIGLGSRGQGARAPLRFFENHLSFRVRIFDIFTKICNKKVAKMLQSIMHVVIMNTFRRFSGKISAEMCLKCITFVKIPKIAVR